MNNPPVIMFNDYQKQEGKSIEKSKNKDDEDDDLDQFKSFIDNDDDKEDFFEALESSPKQSYLYDNPMFESFNTSNIMNNKDSHTRFQYH